MRGVSESLYLVALTAWVGGVWAVGYLVAPLLFASLADRALAGQLAGKFFAGLGWVGLVCGGYSLAYLLARWRLSVAKRTEFWLVLFMLLLTAAGQFGLQPLLAQLKSDALPKDVMESVFRDRFVAWHGISSILYLVQSLLALGLVVCAGRARC